MCIRDSLFIEQQDLFSRSRHARVDGASEPGVVERMQWLAPVSYTHLRAHETVLDLVCRLLLEKKKKQ